VKIRGKTTTFMIADAVLKKAVNKFSGDYSSLKLLGGFNDSVYEVKVNKKRFVIKFFFPSQVNKSLIKGRLDWINYLAENGMKVAKPVFSLQDNFIEEIKENDSLYYYVIFEKLEGDFIYEKDWKKNLIEKWGRAMGKMHNLAKDYAGSDKGKIKEWKANDIFTDPPRKATNFVLKKWEEYVEKLRSFPTCKECYGIIHNDLHYKNVYFHNGKVQVFDFGDCEYSWFVHDIAISLYHAIQVISSNNQKDKLNFATKFMKNFMNGYKVENNIDSKWIKKIPFFLDYRRIYFYLHMLKYLNIAETDENIKEILEGIKYRIENGISSLQGFKVEHVI
jgi:Ser/Thr protein kinase RdoA (MazF antagonist)